MPKVTASTHAQYWCGVLTVADLSSSSAAPFLLSTSLSVSPRAMLAGNGEDSRDAIPSMAKNLSRFTDHFTLLDKWRGVASRDNAPETENQIPIL